MIATPTRERTKIDRNLSGIRHMARLPEALFVVDPHREHIAVAEARKLGIKVVALFGHVTATPTSLTCRSPVTTTACGRSSW